MQEIYTSDQVAKILQIHPQTVLKFIREGRLRASKVGRGYRVKASAIEEFLEETSRHSKTSDKKKTNEEKLETLKVKIEQPKLTNLSNKADKEIDTNFPLNGGGHYIIQ